MTVNPAKEPFDVEEVRVTANLSTMDLEMCSQPEGFDCSAQRPFDRQKTLERRVSAGCAHQNILKPEVGSLRSEFLFVHDSTGHVRFCTKLI